MALPSFKQLAIYFAILVIAALAMYHPDVLVEKVGSIFSAIWSAATTVSDQITK